MRYETLTPVAVLAGGFLLFTAACTAAAEDASAAKSSAATPCMNVLDRFTTADVPALGPAETAVAARKSENAPPPADLPGKGLAQHPMLYIGEGYNKMFLVHEGKVIWTYSTGGGQRIRRRLDALQRQHPLHAACNTSPR